MVDITLCINDECPSKDHCYRKCAEWGEYQSVAEFTYTDKSGCDDYIPMDERDG